MKPEYIIPELKISKFSIEDIIVTSAGEIIEDGTITEGGEQTTPEIGTDWEDMLM